MSSERALNRYCVKVAEDFVLAMNEGVVGWTRSPGANIVRLPIAAAKALVEEFTRLHPDRDMGYRVEFVD